MQLKKQTATHLKLTSIREISHIHYYTDECTQLFNDDKVK